MPTLIKFEEPQWGLKLPSFDYPEYAIQFEEPQWGLKQTKEDLQISDEFIRRTPMGIETK